MDTAKIVVHEVQSYSGFVVLHLLRESVGQTGEAANLHTHRQVLTLDE